MSLYDIHGNIITDDFVESPYLSSASRIRLKNDDTSADEYDLIEIFAPFAVDYATSTASPKVLNVSQSEFYSAFYEPYLGYHDDLLVTKKNLGKEKSGTYDVWCYDFVPYKAKRKILLTSGLHPYELPGSFGLALWIKNYMESQEQVFQWLRENVQLSVIPICNPWGFNQNPKKYGNVDGVNINRNFDTWENVWATFPDYTPEENEWNVKGSAPFSERESKILIAWVKNNTDADFYIDCHTGLGNTAAQEGDVWLTTLSNNVNLTKINNAADAIMSHLASKYSGTPRRNVVVDSANSIRANYITNVIGIPTMTIEQAQASDTIYQTVPNNCKTAISEYATNIHAYIIAQLQSDINNT